jgi:hypothetical protein
MKVERALLSDLKECIDLYYNINDHSFAFVDKNESLKNLYQLYLKKEFIRVIKKDNKIIAWILCIKNKPLHSANNHLQQIYYACSEKGFLAYKCVVVLHNAMIEEAKRIRINELISQGSHLDDNNVFAKILERNGWSRRGYLASYRLPQQDSRLPRHATFLSR